SEITKVNASFSIESGDTTKVASKEKLSDSAVNLNNANLKIYEKKTNTLFKTVPLHGDFEKIMSDSGNSYLFENLSINKEYRGKVEDRYDSGMNHVPVEVQFIFKTKKKSPETDKV
ncbi:hypothetical protein, partial [Listeria monocytogenes]|uniref:hypothetical protein n=1 Tax=Listeria monocytogenes TaxID=1639 RepID=UPI000A985B7B